MKIYNVRWAQFFTHSDLKAGREYACGGKVVDIKQNSKTIKATVKGSKSYKVAFEICDANAISSMNCTCPSFESKRYCKHCAAVLWNLDPLSKEECVQSSLLEHGEEIKCTLPKSASAKEKLEDIVRQVKEKYRNRKIYSLWIIERENRNFKSSTISAWSKAVTGLSLSEYFLSIGILSSPMVDFEIFEDDVNLTDIKGKRCCSISSSGCAREWIDELLKKLGAKIVFPADPDIDYVVIENFNIRKEPEDDNRHAFRLMSIKESGNARLSLLGQNFLSQAMEHVAEMERKQNSDIASEEFSITSGVDIKPQDPTDNNHNDLGKSKAICDILRSKLIKELRSDDYIYPETDGTFSISGIFTKEPDFDLLLEICKYYFSTEATHYDGNWETNDLCEFIEKELKKYHKGDRYDIGLYFGGLPPAVVLLSFLKTSSQIKKVKGRFTHDKWEVRGDCKFKKHVGIKWRDNNFLVRNFDDNEYGKSEACERWDYIPNNYTVAGQPLCLLAYNEVREESDFLVIPSSIFVLKKDVFKGCKFKNIFFDIHNYNIESGAFSECKRLECIAWPNTLYICENMFKNCINLTTVTIPEGVFGIEKGAFAGCKNLVKINIPSTIAFIEEGAFDGCDSLSSNNPEVWNKICSTNKSKAKFLDDIESYKQYIINNGYATFEDIYYGFQYIIDTMNACKLWHKLYDPYIENLDKLNVGNCKYVLYATKNQLARIETNYNTKIAELGWKKTRDVTDTTDYLIVDTEDIPRFTTFIAKQDSLAKGEGDRRFCAETPIEKAIELIKTNSGIKIITLKNFCELLKMGEQ